MEFNGASYLVYNRNINSNVYCCMWNRKLRPQEKEPGYRLFKMESFRKNPENCFKRGYNAIGREWARLSANEKRGFALREGPNQMIERCTGRLKFKVINRQTNRRDGALINYKPHSKG